METSVRQMNSSRIKRSGLQDRSETSYDVWFGECGSDWQKKAALEVVDVEVEMKMLRSSLSVTRIDRITNEQVRGTIKVEQEE